MGNAWTASRAVESANVWKVSMALLVKCVKWAGMELTANQNVPVTMAYATMDCKEMGAVIAFLGGRAQPAKKELRWTYAMALAIRWLTA